MNLFDQLNPTFRIPLLVLGGGFLVWHCSLLLDCIARLLHLKGGVICRWAARKTNYSGVEVMLGTFALGVILLLAATDQNILSFSFYVSFPSDAAMRVLAGLAVTLAEILIGHLIAEAVGLSHYYLDRVFAPRWRALMCVAFLGVICVLLVGQYTLSFRRALLLAAPASDTVTALNYQASGVSPDALASAQTSGFVALAIGLADVLAGIALIPALRALVNILDGILRILAACGGPGLYLVSLVTKAVAAILRLPGDLFDLFRRACNAVLGPFHPLNVRIAVFILAPRASFRLSYPQATRLLRLAARLRNTPEKSEEDELRRTEDELARLIKPLPTPTVGQEPEPVRTAAS